MSSDKVILYDIPAKDQGGDCWSLNTWRPRMVFNYMGIDYETEWVEYPDIAPKLKSFGIPPGSDPETPYTLPAVRFPDGTYVMDSKNIIAEVVKRYPEPAYPPMRIEEPMRLRAIDGIRQAFGPLHANVIPQVPVKCLNDASAEFFHRTRAAQFGMNLAEYQDKNGGEKAWEESKPGFEALAALLRESPGPYFMGENVTYPDFVTVGFLYFVRRMVGEEDWKKVQEWPELINLYEACSKWLERASY
jgi:glutathione S-transferase